MFQNRTLVPTTLVPFKCHLGTFDLSNTLRPFGSLGFLLRPVHTSAGGRPGLEHVRPAVWESTEHRSEGGREAGSIGDWSESNWGSVDLKVKNNPLGEVVSKHLDVLDLEV